MLRTDMTFNEDRFRQDINSSLQHAQKVLDNFKNPQLASAVNHKYDDKFLLVEFLGKISVAGTFNGLNALGKCYDFLNRFLQ